MNKHRIVVITASSVAAIGLLSALIILLRPQPVLPEAVTKQAPVTIFVPHHDTVEINSDTAKFDSATELLSYTVRIKDVSAIISEQPTPEQFNDIPQVYDKVLEQFNQYKKFEAPVGTVYLARPANLKGKQVAIMNTKGTLMFVKPDSDIDEESWKVLFRNLEIIK